MHASFSGGFRSRTECGEGDDGDGRTTGSCFSFLGLHDSPSILLLSRFCHFLMSFRSKESRPNSTQWMGRSVIGAGVLKWGEGSPSRGFVLSFLGGMAEGLGGEESRERAFISLVNTFIESFFYIFLTCCIRSCALVIVVLSICDASPFFG